jgi:Peptidase A4 family
MATGLGPSNAPSRLAPLVLVAFVLSVLLAQPGLAAPIRVGSTPTVNWSGYALVGRGFTGVTGTFNVPAPLKPTSCLEETSVWVGIDGLHNHDLLQAGVAERGFTVPSSRTLTAWPAPGVAPILCGGSAQIYAWWEDLPSSPVQVDLPVHVGDSVTVSIFKMSPGWWALAMHDLMAKQTFFLAQRYDGPQSSVEWVVEAPDVLGLTRDPVPFSAVNFHDLDADGNAHGVERFSFGSGSHLASPSDGVATVGRLWRTGFAVTWARRPIKPFMQPAGGSWTKTSPLRT